MCLFIVNMVTFSCPPIIGLSTSSQIISRLSSGFFNNKIREGEISLNACKKEGVQYIPREKRYYEIINIHNDKLDIFVEISKRHCHCKTTKN